MIPVYTSVEKRGVGRQSEHYHARRDLQSEHPEARDRRSGYRPQRYSHRLLCECREFLVNLPTSALLDKVVACGNVSGRDVRDKFAMAGLTPLPAHKVRSLLIVECPVNRECRLLDDPEPIGDHDLFKGEVLVEHVDAELIDEDGNLRTERVYMLIFARWNFWTAGK